MNWPTENEWDEESGMMRERRLTVLEIVLRAILDPLFTLAEWFYSLVEWIPTYVIESLTRTLQWLDRKYSMGEEKKQYIPSDEIGDELHDLLERILTLIESTPERKIVGILISSQRVLHLFNYSKLPDKIYGYPVVFSPFDNADFALELESGAFLTPLEAPPPQPLLSPVEYRK